LLRRSFRLNFFNTPMASIPFAEPELAALVSL